VLIVDDDSDFALGLVGVLEPRGYQTEVAHGAQEALQAAQRWEPQVALVDVRLGRESGIDLIADLRRIYPQTLCVVMTAYAAVDTAVEAMHHGAYDYLQKPLNMQHLLAILERCFERVAIEGDKAAVERALRESQSLLLSIAQNFPSYLSIVEPDLTVGFTSGREFTKHGLDPDSYVGMTLEQVFGEQAQMVKEQYLLAFEGQEVSFELSVDQQQQLYTVLPLQGDDGKVQRLLAVVEDITERKQAEEALLQRNLELELLNRIGQELTSTLDVQQITQRLLRAVTETIQAEGALVWLQAGGSDGEDDSWLECREAVLPEGHPSPIGLRLRPGEGILGWVMQEGQSALVASVPDDPRYSPAVDQLTDSSSETLLAAPIRASGAVVGIIELANKQGGKFDQADLALVETLASFAAIAIDNARLVEALRKRTDQLRRRNEDLDAYAHTVAHDLKGPLGHIVGLAQVLEQDHAALPEAETTHHLRSIAQSGYKMSNIVDELLLLAGLRRIEDVPISPLEMGEIVTQALGRLSGVVEELAAEIVLPASFPVALGHAPWVEEVWVNYLSNALMYGGQPPRVELGANAPPVSAEDDAAERQIRFWVRDNGPGLTPDEQGRLFRSFERLDWIRAKGHGLGLSIVRRIVTKLGGHVGVESDVGTGSVFWFTLPAPNEA
jgi:signal transduction histidine kinase/ActR/RegA family two-component response regulator